MTSEALMQKLNALPQSCLEDVAHYVDYVSFNYKSKNRDVSQFFGTMKTDEDPLELQKKLRDEWE